MDDRKILVRLPDSAEIERRLYEMKPEPWLAGGIYLTIADALAGRTIEAYGLANKLIQLAATDAELMTGLTLFQVTLADVTWAILAPDNRDAAEQAAAWIDLSVR